MRRLAPFAGQERLVAEDLLGEAGAAGAAPWTAQPRPQKYCLTQTEVPEHDADDYNQTDNINNGVQNVPPDIEVESLSTAHTPPHQKLVR